MGFETNEKSGAHDLVTSADIEGERIIVESIREEYPDHNILAEEADYESTDSEYTWIIDPLDGTNNFAHGLPVWCVSIACAHQGKVICGVVYDPERDELFEAQRGGGARLNGRTISVSTRDELAHSMLVTGFFYDRGEAMRRNLDTIERFFSNGIVGLRRFGSAALDLCMVASGRTDGFWEFELKPWDYAAGALIVQEAGGKTSDAEGKPLNDPFQKSFMVAANPALHPRMLEVIVPS